MDIRTLQAAIGAVVDGKWGPASQTALLAHFTNRQAPALRQADFVAAASLLNASVAQVRAVRQVEAAASGFDPAGKPKILFERHKFHRFTGGRHGLTAFSNPAAGGYGESSWTKLSAAIATGDVDAAFMACSWGAFQVMGQWWSDLGYASPYDLAHSCVAGEGAHLDLMVRFVRHNHLDDELRALSSNPVSCRAFAAAYNGSGYRTNAYDVKLAKAMEGQP